MSQPPPTRPVCPRLLGWTRVILSMILGVQLSAVVTIAQPQTLDFPTLSLHQLIRDADFVFVGKATPLHNHTTLGGGALPARVTQFLIHTSLKGGLREGSQLFVKQFPPHSAPTQPDEIVLWYLKREPNVNEAFASPVGKYSGDFRVVLSEPTKGVLMVQNRVENRGLWSNLPDGRLWNDTFKRSIAKEYLKNYLTKAYPTLAQDPEAFDRRLYDILAFGDAPCKPRPLPLELLLAATHAANPSGL